MFLKNTGRTSFSSTGDINITFGDSGIYRVLETYITGVDTCKKSTETDYNTSCSSVDGKHTKGCTFSTSPSCNSKYYSTVKFYSPKNDMPSYAYGRLYVGYGVDNEDGKTKGGQFFRVLLDGAMRWDIFRGNYTIALSPGSRVDTAYFNSGFYPRIVYGDGQGGEWASCSMSAYQQYGEVYVGDTNDSNWCDWQLIKNCSTHIGHYYGYYAVSSINKDKAVGNVYAGHYYHKIDAECTGATYGTCPTRWTYFDGTFYMPAYNGSKVDFGKHTHTPISCTSTP